MEFLIAKREFDIRYYLWATSEFEKEIEQSFPTIRTFKAGSVWKTHQFMLQLPKRQRVILAHGLLKRFHANAAKALGETCSSEEETLRSRRDGDFSNIASFGEEIRARANAGEPINLASKRQLRKAMTSQFIKAFGGKCNNLACIDEEPDLSFEMNCAGWLVRTSFDFGRKEPLLRYAHSIASKKTFPYRNSRVAMVMGWGMSFNSYLGLSSQTEWHYLTAEEVEFTCNTAAKLCANFFNVLPRLLKGLECEAISPDEGYEISDNPLR
jgi:hypothetical protein